MCPQYICLLIAVFVIGLVNCAPPSNLQICKSGDSKCILQSSRAYQDIFVNGLPEYGVQKLDPLMIKSINASNGNLLFTLDDVTVTGMRNCDIQKLERDNARSQISFRMQCNVSLDGNYVLKGVLLFIPIEGKGKIHVDLKSALFNLIIDIVDKVGEDGKKHWSVKSYNHSFELKDKANVVFENLFNGNKVLAQASEEVINNNSNDVVKEIGSPAILHVIGVVAKAVNKLFKAEAVQDLSLD